MSLYLVLRIREGQAERHHGSHHGLHGHVDVLVDQFGVAPFVLVRVPASVDDPHLFDEGAFAALSGTCGTQRNTLLVSVTTVFGVFHF